MKRWKALTGAALAAALVFAPLVSTGASAAEPVGVIGELKPWSAPTNQASYWQNLYKDHQAQCYYAEQSSDHGTVSADKKTVTLKTFNQSWPGDHWELLVVKSGSEWNNVIVHPVAGVAYASPVNGGDQQGAISHWIVCKGTTPAPTVVTPKLPVVKDKCELANDHYGLPEETIGVTYTRSGNDIIATPATGYVFGALPNGWTLNADKSATYAFKAAQFTDVNCEEVVPVPTVFLATPVPPTCDTDGALPSLNTYPNVALTWDRPFNGPGSYTLTATAAAGFEFPGGLTVKKQVFTVDGKLAAASEACTPPVLNSCAPGQGALSTNLNDLWSNTGTRSKGHVEYVSGGLHVWTEDKTSESKVSEGIAKEFALRHTGVLDINVTKNPGNVDPNGPGINLFVDFDNDGDVDGTLVYEKVYGQDLWLTNGSDPLVKGLAPSHTGGNGSDNHGTINEWLKVFPNAQVKGVAYSLGSGVHGDWTITSIVVNCSEYTFDTAPTTPVPAVFSAAPVAPTCLAEGALPTLGEHPNVALAFDRAYNGPGTYTLTATANAGYTFPDGKTVKTAAFTVDGKLATQSANSAAPCYQAPPTGDPSDPVPSDPGTPTATPAATPVATPAALPATGGVDMMPWGIGGAAMLLAGAAALIMTRRFARR